MVSESRQSVEPSVPIAFVENHELLTFYFHLPLQHLRAADVVVAWKYCRLQFAGVCRASALVVSLGN
jgi:hypothetical protein